MDVSIHGMLALGPLRVQGKANAARVSRGKSVRAPLGLCGCCICRTLQIIFHTKWHLVYCNPSVADFCQGCMDGLKVAVQGCWPDF